MWSQKTQHNDAAGDASDEERFAPDDYEDKLEDEDGISAKVRALMAA